MNEITKKIKVIRDYGINNDIPITSDDGLEQIFKIIGDKKIGNILELGTAIGYGTLNFYNKYHCTIYSIERNLKRFQLASENLNEFPKIKLFFDDALEINISNFPKFDLIYFDAAKSQNIKFYEKYKSLLTTDGIIIVDNLFFHGYVFQKERIQSKNLRQMVRKIKEFHEYMDNNQHHQMVIYNQGDGIGKITKRK